MMMTYLGIRDTNLWTTLERSVIFLIMLHKSLKESFLASNNDMATCLMARKGFLNCNVWRNPGSEESEEDNGERQLSWLMKMFNRYQEMEILVLITEVEITESFLSIVRCDLKYFKMISVDVLEFWPKILKLLDENPQWRPALLIIKICLCAPISNTSLKRLFNQMNLVKPTVYNRLKNSALNALFRIKVSNVSVETFHNEHVLSCVFRYNKKGKQLSQGKWKRYEKREKKVSKSPTFDFSTIPSSSSCKSSDNGWRTCKWTCM